MEQSSQIPLCLEVSCAQPLARTRHGVRAQRASNNVLDLMGGYREKRERAADVVQARCSIFPVRWFDPTHGASFGSCEILQFDLACRSATAALPQEDTGLSL